MKKNVMLAVHCKQSEPVDVESPIRRYIISNYGERQSADCNEDLVKLMLMRKDIVNQTGNLQHLKQLLTKYYCALSMVETRFPIAKGAGNVDISFGWSDAFKVGKKTEQHNIHFEKAAILFNLGAVTSQMGLQADRSTDEGIKEAAKRFQESAGYFAMLRDKDAVRVDVPRPVDVSPECAAMLERLMLAQSQECFYEKVVLDKKSAGLVAKIALQASMFYDEVFRKLNQAPLNQHFERSWVSHVSCKSAMYKLVALRESATALTNDDDIQGCGKGLARLKEAYEVLGVAKREAKQTGKELQDWVVKAEEELNAQYRQLMRENETVYLQRVPDPSTLPAVVATSLVKPTSPDGLDLAKAEELFACIVPDTSAKAMSKYTDMVDNLVRTTLDKLAAASDEARLRLREWELPDCLDALKEGAASGLPDAVKAELQQLEAAGGLTHLMDMAAQIRDMRLNVESELQKAEELLNKEAADDEELRNRFGVRWSAPPSAALTKQMRDKVAGYRNNLSVAGESDRKLMDKLNSNNQGLASLSMEAASSQLPRLQAPMVPVSDDDPVVVVNTLRQAVTTVSQLSTQRAALEEALKEEKGKDNILPKLMASSDHYESLFQSEIAKYDPLVKQIDDNVQRQSEVLTIIAKNLQVYKHVFGYNEWRRACETASMGLRSQMSLYRELRDNLTEGARFYTALQEAVKQLAQQAGDYCLTRRIQRDDLLSDFQRERDTAASMAAMSLQQPQQQPPGQYVQQPAGHYGHPVQQQHPGHPPPQAYANTHQHAQYTAGQYGGQFGGPGGHQPSVPPPASGAYQYQQAPSAAYGSAPPQSYGNYSQPAAHQPQYQGYGQHAPPPAATQYYQNPGYGAPQGAGPAGHQPQPSAAANTQHNPMWGK